MKYLIFLLLLSPAVQAKDGCTITKIVCTEQDCTLIFDDKTEFIIPVTLKDDFKVGDAICK